MIEVVHFGLSACDSQLTYAPATSTPSTSSLSLSHDSEN
jgi:hypothetical protein